MIAMSNTIYTLCLSIAVLLGSAGVSWSDESNKGPSFDCDKASTPTEYAICAFETLSALDRGLAAAYKIAKGLDNSTTLRDEQRQWNKERSSTCGDDVECLSQMYQERIKVLCGDDVECLSFAQVSVSKNLDRNQTFFNWFSVEKNKYPNLNTNQLMWSKQFVYFIIRNSNSKKKLYLGMTKNDKKESLSYHLLEVLSGPSEKVEEKDGVLKISGCRQHSCGEKGLVWIDTGSNKEIFVILHYFYNNQEFVPDGNLLVFSNDFDTAQELPGEFVVDFSNWKKKNKLNNAIQTRFLTTQ